MIEPLYKLTNEYMQLYSELHSIEGLTPEAVNDTLEGFEGDIKEKALNIGRLVRNLEHDVHAFKEAEKRMEERRKPIENKIQSLKDYLLFNLRKVGIENVSSPEVEIKIKKCPPSVMIDDERLLLPEFIREKITREPDKVKLKEALQSGKNILGAHLEQRTTLSIS